VSRKSIFRSAGAAVALLVLVAVPSASARTESVEYPTRDSIREVQDVTPPDWLYRERFGGLCIPVLTCPNIDGQLRDGGGADGNNDGWLRITITDITGIASRATGIWESRTFRYRGVRKQKAQKLRFTIDRNSDLRQLLRLNGRARYDVDFVDVTKGGAVAIEAVKNRDLGFTRGWAEEGPFRLGRNLLKVGNRYFVRISSRFETDTEVINGGYTGYDNIRLIAKRKTDRRRGN
jgi:hypothetical protein